MQKLGIGILIRVRHLKLVQESFGRLLCTKIDRLEQAVVVDDEEDAATEVDHLLHWPFLVQVRDRRQLCHFAIKDARHTCLDNILFFLREERLALFG